MNDPEAFYVYYNVFHDESKLKESIKRGSVGGSIYESYRINCINRMLQKSLLNILNIVISGFDQKRSFFSLPNSCFKSIVKKL